MDDELWTPEAVASVFEEAVATLRKLPPARVAGYVTTWPEVVRSEEEIADMTPDPLRVRPTPEAISRLDLTFDWMGWLTVPERKLVWLKAAKLPWKQICAEQACDRSTAWRRWQRVLGKIARRQNWRR
jgi:hypothetical protein